MRSYKKIHKNTKIRTFFKSFTNYAVYVNSSPHRKNADTLNGDTEKYLLLKYLFVSSRLYFFIETIQQFPK